MQICLCCRGILLNPCRPAGTYSGPTGCDQNALRNANVRNIEQPETCSQLCQLNLVLRRSFAGRSRTLRASNARLPTVPFFSCEELRSAMRGFFVRLNAHPLFGAGRSGKEDSPANDLQRMRSLNVLFHFGHTKMSDIKHDGNGYFPLSERGYLAQGRFMKPRVSKEANV